jgi:hypothetical protein
MSGAKACPPNRRRAGSRNVAAVGAGMAQPS